MGAATKCVLDAREHDLFPKKAYKSTGFVKFIWGGKSAVMGEKPALEPYSVDLTAYDRVVSTS